jgi:hypothetical protein
MDIPSLIVEAHATAVEKGWWEKENPFDAQVANFHSEVSEAWEECRSGRPLDEVYYRWPMDEHGEGESCPGCDDNVDGIDVDANGDYVDPSTLRECPRCGFLAKPEGFTVELADLLIRLFDSAGHYGWEIDIVGDWNADGPAQLVNDLHHYITEILETMEEFRGSPVSSIVTVVVNFCTAHNLPLERALVEKMAYNKTRTYRHGGKKA